MLWPDNKAGRRGISAKMASQSFNSVPILHDKFQPIAIPLITPGTFYQTFKARKIAFKFAQFNNKLNSKMLWMHL